MERAGQRLDQPIVFGDPDRDPRLQARRPAGRTHAGRGVVWPVEANVRAASLRGYRGQVASSTGLASRGRRSNQLPRAREKPHRRSGRPRCARGHLPALRGQPAHERPGDPRPSPTSHSAVTILVFVDDGARAQRRRRLRAACSTSATSPSTPSAPTRRAGSPPTSSSRSSSTSARSGSTRRCARHPHLDLARAPDRAAIVTALGGILIGLPTLRLRGDYLAIVTLGFGEIIPQFVRNADNLARLRPHPRHRSASTRSTHPASAKAPQRRRAPGVLSAGVRADRLFFWTCSLLLLVTIFCASACATRGSAAPGSPSARTRPPPRRWASRSCARRSGPTRSAPSSAGSPAPTIASFNSVVPEPVLLQHLDLPALHGHPRRDGEHLGRRRRRRDPVVSEPRGAREHRQLAEQHTRR